MIRPPRNSARLLLAITRFAIVTWLATWTLAVGTIAVGGSVDWWHSVLGLACGSLALRDPRLTTAQLTAIGLTCVVVVAAAVLTSVAIPDFSIDANVYHFPAEFALADGWNPLFKRDDPIVLHTAKPGIDATVRCYPKAVWIWSASAYRIFGNIDAGKMLEWLMIFAPVGPAFCFFRTRIRCSPRASLLGSLLVSANPVTTCQLTSGYLDGVLASLLATFLFSSMLIGNRLSRGFGALAGLCACLLVGTKFTGPVYAAVIAATITVFYALQKRPVGAYVRRVVVGSAVGLLLSFDSYGLNVIEHGNPFHPAWHPSGSSTIEIQTSADFRRHGRFEKLIRSLGARQMPPDHELTSDPSPRIPFTEIRWNYRYDSRFAGFGPLFWEALLLALLLLATRLRPEVYVALVAVIASALSTDAVWWARLAPHLWLVPLLLALNAAAPKHGRRPIWRFCRILILALLVSNAAIVAYKSLRDASKHSRTWIARILDGTRTLPWEQLDATRRSVSRRIAESRQSNGLESRSSSTGTIGDLDPFLRMRLGLGLGIDKHAR